MLTTARRGVVSRSVQDGAVVNNLTKDNLGSAQEVTCKIVSLFLRCFLHSCWRLRRPLLLYVIEGLCVCEAHLQNFSAFPFFHSASSTSTCSSLVIWTSMTDIRAPSPCAWSLSPSAPFSNSETLSKCRIHLTRKISRPSSTMRIW